MDLLFFSHQNILLQKLSLRLLHNPPSLSILLSKLRQAKLTAYTGYSTLIYLCPNFTVHLLQTGTIYSFTVAVFASNFTAYNISFQNTAPVPSPGVVGAQAIALRIVGDQAAFYGCGVYGAQDTLHDDRGKHYFRECFIQESIDFIFGNGRSLYEECTINSIAKEVTSGISRAITAHGRQSINEK